MKATHIVQIKSTATTHKAIVLRIEAGKRVFRQVKGGRTFGPEFVALPQDIVTAIT